MQRYKCVIAYDGSQFSGFQIQPQARTVQGEIEAVLKKMHKGKRMKVVGSGRTDAGVHAYGQVVHFDSPLQIEEAKWQTALNSLLPADIVFRSIVKTDQAFHARHSAIAKEYRYKIYTSPSRNPFKRHYALHFPFPLNTEKIKEAIPLLVGTHDFTSFCSAKTDVAHKVRTVTSIDIREQGDELIFIFNGEGFLYHMVRIMTGTLLEIGNGKRQPEEITAILQGKDRTLAGKTAPPEGLYLSSVFYDD